MKTSHPDSRNMSNLEKSCKVGSAEYYLQQMEDRLFLHGETRPKWSWAIQRMGEWKDVASQLYAAHYIVDPDLRAAKHREALERYISLWKFE